MSREARLRTGLARPAFTLVELIVCIFVILLLIAFFLPTMRVSGEAARRINCANHFKQLGLALHSYHDIYNCFPAAMGGTDVGATPLQGNANRLSGLVALLPFLEQERLYNEIASPLSVGETTYPAMGPAPWISEYPPWQQQIPTFMCPSSPDNNSLFGHTNYTFCIGDIAEGIHQPSRTRGAFRCRWYTRLDDIKDGTSHTIAMAEIATKSGLAVAGDYAVNQPAEVLMNPALCNRVRNQRKLREYSRSVTLDGAGRGARWADGAAGVALVSTILPPNSPSCAAGGSEAVDGIYSTGSFHRRGVQTLMADGSVQFMFDGIDTGDLSRPPIKPGQLGEEPLASPYGVWGALGTAAAADKASDSSQ